MQTLSLAWDEEAQKVVIECHDHDPDEVDEDAGRRGGSARAQLDPGRPDAGRGPRLRAAQQRARRRRSAAVPVLRQPTRPHGPHLPAGQWLQALTRTPPPVDLTGELEVLGRITESSNLAVVARISSVPGGHVIYKPVRGERPLWDFPDGTLAGREVAAQVVSELGGWHVVPPTVLRDGPLGPGLGAAVDR